MRNNQKKVVVVTEAQTVTPSNDTSVAAALFSSPVPFYGTIIISVACFILLICCCCWMCIHLRRRKETKPKMRTIRAKSIAPAGITEEAIQPDMEDFMNSDQEEAVPPDYVGKLHYSLEYNIAAQTLSVLIIEGRDLPAMDIGGTSDPYVKVRLVQKKKPTYCTKIVKANCNPLFNETFTFDISYVELSKQTLVFSVFDHDTFGADDSIGLITIPLGEKNLGNPITEWANIVKAGGSSEREPPPGDICLSLRYVAASNLLTVVVLEAKNLRLTSEGEPPDSFVKLILKIDNRRVKMKKTTVRKACINPYFNESFNFDVPYQQVQAVVLQAIVATPGRLKSKPVGLLEIGLNVPSAPQALHWSDMLANPRHPVARWHPLQKLEQEND